MNPKKLIMAIAAGIACIGAAIAGVILYRRKQY